MSDNSATKTVDLTNCDREPIHILGQVQPHGIVFACGVEDWRILHASQNTDWFFGRSAADLIGE